MSWSDNPYSAQKLDDINAISVEPTLRKKADKLNSLVVFSDPQKMREQLRDQEIINHTLYLANHICCTAGTNYCKALKDETGQLKNPDAAPPVTEAYLIATLNRAAYIYSKGRSSERERMETQLVDRLKRSTGLSRKWLMSFTNKGQKALPLLIDFASTKVFTTEPAMPVLEHESASPVPQIVYIMAQNHITDENIQTLPGFATESVTPV